MASKSKSTCWADMEIEEEAKKMSYVSIASKNVCPTNDDDDIEKIVQIIEIIERNEMIKKCENAVLEWAADNDAKGTFIEVKSAKAAKAAKAAKTAKAAVGDEEIVCKSCALPFVFGGKTKEKYEQRCWKSPKICKTCSQNRFQQKNSVCA